MRSLDYNSVKLDKVLIGGIHENNVMSVIQAGADGIALVSAISQAPDPQKAASDLRAQIERARLSKELL